MSKTGALLLRVVLGALFIYSGAAKLGFLGGTLGDPLTFAGSVWAFKILHQDVVLFATYAFPWMEIVCGAALILGLTTQAAAAILGLMLLAFCGAMFKVIFSGDDVECGCFGKVSNTILGYILTTKVGWTSVARNVVLLALVTFVAVRGPGYAGLDLLFRRRCCGREAD
ncbi:MAG: DoxX family membrane protein [Planctomycetes bacterium]|nr:DoxX family membrane protein [Planctomycetota bacterium]